MSTPIATPNTDLGNLSELYTPAPSDCTCFAAGWGEYAEYINAPATIPAACGWCGTWTPPTQATPHNRLGAALRQSTPQTHTQTIGATQ